jgi:subtilisin-like proprotein convertase family protein
VYGGIYADHFDPEAAVRGLGEEFLLPRGFIKVHACGRYIHGALDCLEVLMARRPLPPESIQAIRVRTYAMAASLDLDPERDGATFNGIAGVSILNWGGNYLMMNEAPSGVPPVGNATAFTVQAEGRYYALVQDMTEGGGLSYTYRLSISLQSPPQVTSVCTTYSSTDVPKSITGSFIQSTLTVPGHPRIADLDVSLGLTHGRAEDLDLQLTAPAGSTSSLLTDIPSVLTTLLMTLDDEAAQPPPFLLPGFVWQPERSYRLSWFDGEDAGGTWTLRIHDDAVGNAGALTSWSLKICEPDPACPSGTAPVDLFTTDFETGPAGFTHAGTSDEWEWGLPAFPPITGCNSGSHCWKTDLDNTYDASSVQDLLSPVIDLSGITAPLRASWAQKYQMEDAASDHAFAEIQEIPAANPKKLFEFLDATMTDSVGSGPTLVDESAGWGVATADISSYASKHVQMRFHLDSNATVDLAGYAIDDVRVFMCCPSIAVGPTTLPGGREGVFYSQTLMATGGAGPHGFAVASGSLPPGLSLSTGGVLSGTPSAAGVYNLGVKATDTTGCYAATNLTITVALGPHEASPSQNMTVQRLPTGLVLVTYTPACGATDHVIYQGTGPIAGALSWNRAICNRGTGGSTSYNPLNNAPGAFVYFVIVGQNATEEGSYGRSSAGIERPEATIVSTCDKPKILTGPCP